MSQDQLPIKIVVIPPSAAQVSRAMADIEAKVKSSGRRIGQAMAVKPGGKDGDAAVRAYYAKQKRLDDIRLVGLNNNIKAAKASFIRAEAEKLSVRKQSIAQAKSYDDLVLLSLNNNIKASRAAFIKAEADKLMAKKAAAARAMAVENQMTGAFVGELKRRTRAAAQEERRRTAQAKVFANKRIQQERAASKKAKAAAFAKSPEGIFQAAGIKSPQRRIAEIKNLRLAQQELRRELVKGTITRLQYNTMLKDTKKRLNLLQRGDVRARGALHRFTAQLASTTFEITGAIFGLTALGLALSSPAIAGTKYLAQLEDVKLGISGILLAMGSINGEMLTFAQASAAADEQIKALANDAISLAGTLEDFTKSFQAILAPGLAAGMTLTEIRKIAVAGTVAVKTIGLDSRQIVQEIRDLVAGGIQAASSTLATSLGLTDRDIKKAKLSSEGLFKFLSTKLDGFRIAGLRRSETLSGKIEQTYEMFIRGLAEGSQPVFETLKKFFDDISSEIATIDKLTGALTFKPKFIDGVKAFIIGIDQALKALVKVVKVTWEFKELLGAIIVLKVGRTIFGIMKESALAYHGVLKGILATEIILQATQKPSLGRFGPTKARAGAIHGAGGAAAGAAGASLAGLASTANLKSMLSAARSLVFKVIGRAGLWGLAIWGIYEAGSAIWNSIAPVKKIQAEIQKTTDELKAAAAKAQDRKALGLLGTIEALEKLRFSRLDQGLDVSGLDKGIQGLKDQYKISREAADNFSEANLTVSERITRMDASATAAKKSIAALGGEFDTAAKKVAERVQAIIDIEKLTADQKVFRGILNKKDLGAEAKQALSEKIVLNDEILKGLRLQLDLINKLQAAEVRVAVAPKGSREKDEATGALAKLKKRIPLLGEQIELQKQLAASRAAVNRTDEVVARERAIEQQVRLNQVLIDSVNALNPAAVAQATFNSKLLAAGGISRDYIANVNARIAVQKEELDTTNRGFVRASAADLKDFGSAVNDVLDKYNTLRQTASGTDLNIIDAQETAELQSMSDKFVQGSESQKIFFDTRSADAWTLALSKAGRVTKDYIKKVEDKIALNKAELEFAGKSGLEISIIKTKVLLQDALNKSQRKYTDLKLKDGANILALDKESLAKREEMIAANNRLIDSLRVRNEEERKFTTGAEAFFKGYVTSAGDAAAIATEFFSSTMSSFTSELSLYFQKGEGSFKSFKNAVSKGLADIAAQMVTAGIVQAGTSGLSGLLGMLGGGGGITTQTPNANGVANTSFFNAKGNAFDPSGLVAFAKGGIVSTPTTFPFAKGTGLMGEAGPEAIMPLSRTTSGDLGVKVSGGQGGTTNQVNVEVNISSDGTAETNTSGAGLDGRGIGDAIGQVVQTEILKQMRPGGLLTQR